MEIVDVLISFNKISLLALLVILAFLAYQIYLIKKETENKKENLIIPDFKVSPTQLIQSSQPIAKDEKKIYTKSSKTPLIAGLILFFVFGMIFIAGLFRSKAQMEADSNALQPTPMVNFVASRGIKIYNQNWVEFSDDSLSKIQPGDKVFIGIETIKQVDIDMARIRVNKSKWDQNDITRLFDKRLNVFFKEHTISTGESLLRIEAQLHSKIDGWLGD